MINTLCSKLERRSLDTRERARSFACSVVSGSTSLISARNARASFWATSWAEAEAKQVTEKAQAMVATAKAAYMAALVPYREAFRKDGVECEFEGSRGRAVSGKVFFEVERVEKGVRVMIKGRADTEEIIPLSTLKESAGVRVHRETSWPQGGVGNKGGTLANRMRTTLAR